MSDRPLSASALTGRVSAGRIDIYPEYTGTALTAILKQQPSRAGNPGSDRKAVYERVNSEYEKRFHLTLGPPFGFNDTFAIEIRGDDARRLHLQTISQSAAYTPRWRAGFGYEFMERPDGYKGPGRDLRPAFRRRRASWILACSLARSDHQG
jgi:glycine betaine/choline ABC-type transport system substrate-binding protein